jgi:hypothetical protein
MTVIECLDFEILRKGSADFGGGTLLNNMIFLLI